MSEFKRVRLQHSIPPWVKDGEIYFITINTLPRGKNQLATPEVATAIKTAIQNYTNSHKWHPKLAVLMPDHLHLLVSLNTARHTIKEIIAPWKGYLAKNQPIAWQDEFFEHRIRDRASLEEKEQYLRLNPVRAKLVNHPEDWPYLWTEADFQR
jgi:REP element-mobilizing transposase RayT